MFSPEQKEYIFENSVKIEDQAQYVHIMSLYEEYFKKAKFNSIMRPIGLIIVLLFIAYSIGCTWLVPFVSFWDSAFKISAMLVGVLVLYRIGKFVLDYIDDLPIIAMIKNKECDLLCYTGDLNDVTGKVFNLGTSTDFKNYYAIISGNKFQINKKSYKMLAKHKGKKIKIYYFAELLNRQLYITEGSVILVE